MLLCRQSSRHIRHRRFAAGRGTVSYEPSGDDGRKHAGGWAVFIAGRAVGDRINGSRERADHGEPLYANAARAAHPITLHECCCGAEAIFNGDKLPRAARIVI
jgi:hypothetical protein